MPRSNRARRGGRPRARGTTPPARPGSRESSLGQVSYAGQVWAVRAVRPNDTGRSYRCPGCQQEVTSGVAHTVVWPVEGMQQAENRRHWHTVCWSARERRRPGGSFA